MTPYSDSNSTEESAVQHHLHHPQSTDLFSTAKQETIPEEEELVPEPPFSHSHPPMIRRKRLQVIFVVQNVFLICSSYISSSVHPFLCSPKILCKFQLHFFQHYLRTIKHMVKEEEESKQKQPSSNPMKLSTLEALERAVELVGEDG
jgi:hypothetical protein